jgi:hypothetical protein
MAVYLDEEYVGSDPDEIIYPHLLLCMGVTCQMSDGRLFGAHITNANTENAVLGGLKSKIRSQPSKPVRLYITGDAVKHRESGGKTPLGKAEALDYAGPVFVYDTGKLNPTDGSFVRVVSTAGGLPCAVYAMKDQDARPYTTVVGEARYITQYYQPQNAFRNTRFYKVAHNAAGNPPALAVLDFEPLQA